MQHFIFNKIMCDFILDTNSDFRIKLVGTSMEPVFKSEQAVFVGNVDVLKPGCCYLFRYGMALVVHRLAVVRDSDAVFLGDNCRTIESIPIESVYGTVSDAHTALFHSAVACVNKLFLAGCSRCTAFSVRRDLLRRGCIRVLLEIDNVIQRIITKILSSSSIGAVYEKEV